MTQRLQPAPEHPYTDVWCKVCGCPDGRCTGTPVRCDHCTSIIDVVWVADRQENICQSCRDELPNFKEATR